MHSPQAITNSFRLLGRQRGSPVCRIRPQSHAGRTSMVFQNSGDISRALGARHAMRPRRTAAARFCALSGHSARPSPLARLLCGSEASRQSASPTVRRCRSRSASSDTRAWFRPCPSANPHNPSGSDARACRCCGALCRRGRRGEFSPSATRNDPLAAPDPLGNSVVVRQSHVWLRRASHGLRRLNCSLRKAGD